MIFDHSCAHLQAEIADCSFAPTRYSSKTSDLYLKRMGREAPIEPEDLFRYQQDKFRRNELRRQILNEIEEKELTFKPQLNEKSVKIQVRRSLVHARWNGCIGECS